MIQVDKVCAIIVSFHPTDELVCNIRKLRPQVGGVIVVDNGSSESELRLLLDSQEELDIELIRNGDNLGIAAALNIGVRRAVERGASWVVLFDQDSTVTDAYIETMLQTYHSHPRRDSIAIVGPAYEERYTGLRDSPRLLAKDGGPVEVMTSGTMIPAVVFSVCGYFREDFVIDEVDHEFCFRVRDHAFIVVRAQNAVLVHQPGTPKRLCLFGVVLVHATNHSAKRQYYMARNGVVLVRKYWRRYPKWAYETLWGLARSVANLVIAEDDKYNKVRNVLLGVRDGILGNMGQVVKL